MDVKVVKLAGRKAYQYTAIALPFPIHKVQCDNGTEFALTFALPVQEAGIRLRYIRPRQPQQNGKVERSHRIDTEEFWRREAPPDFMTALPALQAWERRYNFARFSVAQKGEAPAERLQRLLPDVKVA